VVTSTADNRFAEAWRLHRPYLVDLAFRMLGNIGDAEDVVQEAFSRLLRETSGHIDDGRGWLTVVTSRLCLDQIRSARHRHERVTDLGADEHISQSRGSAIVDPADRVTLDDNVRLALLVVLERLGPAERVVFVLHDIFRLPFATVAETLGKTEPNCRQLASRARKKVQDLEGPLKVDVAASQHRLVTEKFITACANGDLPGLLEVLDPGVSGHVDIRIGQVVVGAERVGRNLLHFWSKATLVSQFVGAQPAALAFVDRELAAILILTMGADKITKIHVVADPAKIDFLRSQLSSRP
jgi:RNA polymerase sigma-70 factor (ECF subfamily)